MADEAVLQRPVDGRLLAIMAASGVLIGILASFGAIAEQWELFVWIAFGMAWLLIAVRRIPDDAFRHLSFGAMLAGFLASDMKILFWESFLAHHPALVAAAAEAGAPKTSLVLWGTLQGLVFGLLLGLASKMVVKNRGVPGAASPVASAVDEEE